MAGVLAVFQAWLLGRYALRAVAYERSFSRLKAWEGETVEMIETLENRKWLPVCWLRVESRMPPELSFGEQDNLDIAEERYHRSFFFLGPYQRVVRRHTVKLRARGFFDLSSVALTSGDLFGLRTVSRSIDLDLRMTVFPKPVLPREIDAPSTRFMGDIIVKRFIVPDLFLVQGIRPWRDGDSMRDIHWGASAKTGEIKVKQRDFTASPKLLVLLNIQTTEDLWGELNTRDLARVEDAVRVCAGILLTALDRGVETGFGSNGEMKTAREKTILLWPMCSEEHRTAVLDVLARISPRRVKSFHTYLDEIGASSGLDILIMTPYVSEMIAERVAAFKRKGNTVTLLSWEGSDARETVA